MMTKALQDVIAERTRQIEGEGWTPEHDDIYRFGELAWAAACYATQSTGDLVRYRNGIPVDWPWGHNWWKPQNPRRDLVKAGALILAEIERLDRLEERSGDSD